jgi:hypothetical protein
MIGGATTQIKKAIQSLINPRLTHTNLNGKWRGSWHVERPRYPKINEFEATITHIGNSIKSTFVSNGQHYPLEGTIHRANLITGIWGSPDAGATYFGPFQLVILPDGKSLKGRWSGFTSDNDVHSGLFEWTYEG